MGEEQKAVASPVHLRRPTQQRQVLSKIHDLNARSKVFGLESQGELGHPMTIFPDRSKWPSLVREMWQKTEEIQGDYPK